MVKVGYNVNEMRNVSYIFNNYVESTNEWSLIWSIEAVDCLQCLGSKINEKKM